MFQTIRLSDHFTYGKLLRFTLPSMGMMIFTSVYSVVDGLFVSNFAGKTPFAALNLIFPFLMFLSIVGFMFGSGGSALIAKTMGEGKPLTANRIFSMLVCVGFLSGLLFAAVGWPLLDNISRLLGADESMVSDCVMYGRILLIGLPFFILQIMFQSLLVTAEKPRLGFRVTIISGVLNMPVGRCSRFRAERGGVGHNPLADVRRVDSLGLFPCPEQLPSALRAIQVRWVRVAPDLFQRHERVLLQYLQHSRVDAL